MPEYSSSQRSAKGNYYPFGKKYIELTKFSLDIMRTIGNCNQFLDDQWNTTISKMIDNSIILLMGKSVK